nr:MAG TPA: hypothetical protein [Caudoviricetes sp.]
MPAMWHFSKSNLFYFLFFSCICNNCCECIYPLYFFS